MTPDLASVVDEALRSSGIDLARVGRAWARAAPLVVLVPAFGLRALPVPVRAVLGLAFALVIFTGVATFAPEGDSGAAGLALEIARGIPIALATAVPLWAATAAGGLADSLRGTQESAAFTVVEGRATPVAVLFSLAASATFLATGGPARAVQALVEVGPTSPWLTAADALARGIGLSIAMAAPMLGAAIVLEVASALIARAASPAHVDALLAPVKAVAVLVLLALSLDRVVALAR